MATQAASAAMERIGKLETDFERLRLALAERLATPPAGVLEAAFGGETFLRFPRSVLDAETGRLNESTILVPFREVREVSTTATVGRLEIRRGAGPGVIVDIVPVGDLEVVQCEPGAALADMVERVAPEPEGEGDPADGDPGDGDPGEGDPADGDPGGGAEPGTDRAAADAAGAEPGE